MAFTFSSEASTDLLSELKSTCDELRCQIKSQYAPALTIHFWCEYALDDNESMSGRRETIIFAMEYIHATAASDLKIVTNFIPADPTIAKTILDLSEKAKMLCFQLGLTSLPDQSNDEDLKELELTHQILAKWVMLRGKRYAVLEYEFFEFCLAAHDEVFKKNFDIGSAEIAREIQGLSDLIRKGLIEQHSTLSNYIQSARHLYEAKDLSYESLIEKWNPSGSEEDKRISEAFEDIFKGELFNASKHTKLPAKLLKALAHIPGENNRFCDGSTFSGTPLNTLPAKLKPFIEINNQYYFTDPNFVRDSAYRALERAIIAAEPDYRENWNHRQKEMSETAFPTIMKNHLKGHKAYTDVYYRLKGNNWAETDCIIIIDDTLICIEAKAGAEPINSPALNLDRHLEGINDLIRKAFNQTNRFISHLNANTSDTVQLYSKSDNGHYRPLAKISLSNFRNVIPVGLTLEALTPFSSAANQESTISPILGKYNFISLSVDDLMAIKRILPDTGNFIHYLEVRQAAAGNATVSLYDEMDHLGAYISQNRYDLLPDDFEEEGKIDKLILDGFDQDVIAPFFESPDWPNASPPTQKFPKTCQAILSALEETQDKLWLSGNAILRNLDSKARENIDENFQKVLSNLKTKKCSHFALGNSDLIFFALSKNHTRKTRKSSQLTARKFSAQNECRSIHYFEISVRQDGTVKQAAYKDISE